MTSLTPNKSSMHSTAGPLCVDLSLPSGASCPTLVLSDQHSFLLLRFRVTWLWFFLKHHSHAHPRTKVLAIAFWWRLLFQNPPVFLSLLAPFQAVLDHFNMASHHSSYPIPPHHSITLPSFIFFLTFIAFCYFFAYLLSFIVLACFPIFYGTAIFPALRTEPHSRCSRNIY